ncbi:MAG: phage-shock protein [Bacilli bacterium]|jgi:phage shock protein C|nr:phage-shock protein [Bacilli bacterium]
MSKIYRSRSNKKLFGLCGGLAQAMNVDVTLLRLVVVVTTFFTGGTVIALYVIASIAIPKEPLYDTGSMYGWEQPSYSTSKQPSGSMNPSMAYGAGAWSSYAQQPKSTTPGSSNNIDEMMKDIEQKALHTELQQLRAKLAQYEKGEV